MTIKPGYESLAVVLNLALEQAQSEKGSERHTRNGKEANFTDQYMIRGSRIHGMNGPLFQAGKKIEEVYSLPTKEAKIEELLGAINYIAGAVMWLQKEQELVPNDTKDCTDTPATITAKDIDTTKWTCKAHTPCPTRISIHCDGCRYIDKHETHKIFRKGK